MIKKAPIIFAPFLKTVMWGGEKICRYKGIQQSQPNIGESWEISAVPGYESKVSQGEYEGFTISELVNRFGEELLGSNVTKKYGKKFPLLIKFIDASDNLSVQVHPDDKLAKERHDSLGKTEMWYIISADRRAKIYAGLNTEMTPEEYEKRVKEGTFPAVLATYESHPGDVFFLPAGQVHSIGAGNLLAEIQESSDITYRIYDYDRRDANGNTRELHTHLAKDAIDYKVYPYYKNPPIDDTKNIVTLVECEHFKTYLIKVEEELKLTLDPESFSVLMCVEGKTRIIYQEGQLEIKEGQTILIPASLNSIALNGKGKLLMTRV